MANLFWGVSDALDLYDEFIEAKTQIASKLPTKRQGAGEEVAIQMKNESIPIISNYVPPPIIESDEDTNAENVIKTTENVEEKDIDTNVIDGELESKDNSKNNEENSQTNENVQENLIESDVKDSNNDQDLKESQKTENTDDTENIISSNDEIQSEIKAECEIKQEINHPNDQSDIKNLHFESEPVFEVVDKTNSSEHLDNGVTLKTDEQKNVSNDENEEKEETAEENQQEILNILIFGGGDPRHIIKTMAKRYTHCQNEGNASKIPLLKFYIVDGSIEIIARNMLLLGIALEKPDQLSLRNKVHLFMDIYGNSLLRPFSYQYLTSKAITLLKMVSDRETMKKIAPFVHIENLKYREIDALQDAFEFWQPKPGYDFKIKDYWLGRLRRLLAVRYDSRDGVFDWDLNMSLKDRGCEQICSQEYRYWRETGIAFTFPEYEQCKPNKTLAAGLTRNGGHYLHHGYVGDIQTGPFCTFGLRSLEERMHHSAHGQNDFRSTDVTERNLLEYFHELHTGTPYEHNKELFNKYGGVRFQMGERLIHNECDLKNISAYDQPWVKVEGVEVYFLPLENVYQVGKGAPKWLNFFDIAFVGYKYFEFLKDTFPKVLKKDSLIIFETKLRSVEIKNRIKEFETDLLDYARCANLLGVLNYNALNSKNSILKFWKHKGSVQQK